MLNEQFENALRQVNHKRFNVKDLFKILQENGVETTEANVFHELELYLLKHHRFHESSHPCNSHKHVMIGYDNDGVYFYIRTD